MPHMSKNKLLVNYLVLWGKIARRVGAQRLTSFLYMPKKCALKNSSISILRMLFGDFNGGSEEPLSPDSSTYNCYVL